MQRDLHSLARDRFDLVVVGGGIYGAAMAWEASLRGLGVALIEQGDFGAATSANSLKVIHGGFRYLQSFDFSRVRLSLNELAILLKIAPHLVSPLACLLPTKGLGKQGRPALAAALALYNLLNQQDNLGGRLVSRQEATRLFPAFDALGGSGGALWHDGLAHDSERLPLSYLLGAADLGAQLANYTQMTGLVREDGQTAGVTAKDILSGDELEVRGRVVALACGPWGGRAAGLHWPRPALATALNLLVDKELCRCAVALRSPLGREADPVCGGHRFIVMVPWQGRTMLGTAYQLFDGDPARARPTSADLLSLLGEFNAACPELGLAPEDISFYHWGVMPLARPGAAPNGGGLAAKRRIEMHEGMLMVTGSKYTTARAVAVEAVDRACALLGGAVPPSRSHEQPVWGGETLDEAVLAGLPRKSAEHLKRQYGSQAGQVSALAGDAPALLKPLAADTPVLGCEVLQAVEHEMALKLRDVALSRTVLGKAGRPSHGALAAASRLMASRLGWNEARQEREMAQVTGRYSLLEELA